MKKIDRADEVRLLLKNIEIIKILMYTFLSTTGYLNMQNTEVLKTEILNVHMNLDIMELDI